MQEPKQPLTAPHVDTTGAPSMTRDCLDPWTYLEVSARGDLRPCCHFSQLATLRKEVPDVALVRDNEGFRALRQSLLSGNLHQRCQSCHIRKMVPTEVLKRRLAAARSQACTTDVLAPLPITEFRIDITTKCNLRCDYCSVSAPSYHGVEMTDAVFERIVPLLGDIDPAAAVYVNGHGETTYHPEWMRMCRNLIDSGFRPLITTNLAKVYSDEELDLLSRFARIEVSLDSGDNELMRTIRKAVRVEHIFETIQRIRDVAASQGQQPPDFGFSIGIYDPSIWSLEAFVDRIIRVGVTNVTFWDLVEKPHQTLVKALHRLDTEQQRSARRILAKTRRKLDLAGIQHQFAGDFHAMIFEPTWTDRLRMVLGRAYAAASRHSLRAVFRRALSIRRTTSASIPRS